MRLIRLVVTLAVLTGLGYVGVTVPLGGKTLWGHLKAIAGSRESKELVEGVKQKAKQAIGPDAGAATTGTGDELTAKERRLLRELIRDKLDQGGKVEEEAAPGKKPAKKSVK